jgi:UDP-N-acetylmuramoylalanine--D-glutamate ligase
MSGGNAIDGRPVTVMGLGLFGGGAAVARHLAGAGARVTVTDLRGAEILAPALDELADLDITWSLGGHRTEDFTGAALVVANPAVPSNSPFLTAARNAGVPVTSELALFLEACPATVVLVTGTQGKSSTCQMLAGLLEAGQEAGAVHLGGNIGRSLLGDLPGMAPEDRVVLEVSSYQLAALSPEECRAIRDRGRVTAAAVTNVLEDHLEQHGTVEAYVAAKGRVLDLVRAGGLALVPALDPRMADRVPEKLVAVPFGRDYGDENSPHLRLAEGRLWDGDIQLGDAGELRIPGSFQADNLLVAAGLAHALGVDPETIAGAVSTLTGLPHRMEVLGRAVGEAGPHIVDNGVSTTPDSTLSALRSIEAPVILLCGGRDKGLDFSGLVAAARGHARLVVAFGESAPSLATRFGEGGLETLVADDLTGAVHDALAAAGPEDTVLFSPACSSFDAYANFRERAGAFLAALASSSVADTWRGKKP